MPAAKGLRFVGSVAGIAWIAAGATMGTVAGCGGGSSSSAARTTSLELFVAWPGRGVSRMIPVAAECVRVVVTGPNGFSTTADLVRPQTSITLSGLPVADLTVAASAYPTANPSGAIAQASAVRTVSGIAGGTSRLDLSLDSTIARVEVSADPPSVRRGASGVLGVSAYDASGRLVLTRPSSWTFVPDASGILAVHGGGDSTTFDGLAKGTGRITATETESGKSIALDVPVTTPLPTLSLGGPSTLRLVGESSTLSWDSTDADRVVSSTFGAGAVSGSATVSPRTTTTYTLKVANDLGETVEKSVEVRVAIVGLDVNPASAEVDIRKHLSFAATVTGAVDTGAIWSVVEADGGSIGADGVYTAPAVQGTYHVRAASVADPTKTKDVAVRVRAAGGGIEIR